MLLKLIFCAIDAVVNFVIDIIVGIFDFFNECVNWFKNLYLNRHKDVPFIANANKEEFKKMLSNAPRKNCGIFEGVYDQETDEITKARYVAADGIDEPTRNTLGNEPLVILQ